MKCKGCHKTPSELIEYRSIAAIEHMSPEEYVRQYEGTYNSQTGSFYCTTCYVKAGMPSIDWQLKTHSSMRRV